MTKTNRIISVLLSVILAFSTLPLLAYANAIPEKTETLDKLIQSDSIANLVEWLLKSLDKRKDKVTGTVLRYVLFALKDEDVKKAVGEKDALKLSDEEAAKILVNFLNAYLPKVTESFTGEDWWPIVQNIAKGIGLTVDLSSVDGAIKTLRSLCELVKGILDFGDAEGLNGSALKDVSVGKSGNLGVIKALIKWLADNTDIVKRVLTKGESLSLGIVDNVAGGTGAKVGKKLQEAISPEAIKKALYKGIKLDETEYESSAYKNFSADELLAAKFVQLMAGNTEKVAKDDAQKVLKYTIYDFFTKYANQAYAKFLIPELEKPKVKEAFKKINMHNTFNLDYKFDDDTFSDLITSGMEGGFVEQFNNVVYRILETILTPETLAKLDLKEGGNENLDENFAKVLRYILPLINESGVDIGYDFSQFTEESVKTMETEEMAVAVLKIFYPGWFHFGPDDAFKRWLRR